MKCHFCSMCTLQRVSVDSRNRGRNLYNFLPPLKYYFIQFLGPRFFKVIGIQLIRYKGRHLYTTPPPFWNIIFLKGWGPRYVKEIGSGSAKLFQTHGSGDFLACVRWRQSAKPTLYMFIHLFIHLFMCFQEHTMFSDDEDERVTHLSEVEKICEIYSYADLQDLNNRLQENSTAKQVNFYM